MSAGIDGDAEALRAGARRSGATSRALDRAGAGLTGVGRSLAADTLVGPAGDRLRAGVDALQAITAAAAAAFEQVATALDDLAGPIEELTAARQTLARTRQQEADAVAAFEAVDPLLGAAGGLTDPTTAPLRQALEEARQAVIKAEHEVDGAEVRKRAAVRRFVTVCDAAASDAPALPAAPARADPDQGLVGGALRWTGKQGLELLDGVVDGGVDAATSLAFLAEAAWETSEATEALDIAGRPDKSDQLSQGLTNVRDHPGDFAKALINWDDLSKGRYAHWAGQLGFDVALTVFTGGIAGGAKAGAGATVRAARDASDLARAEHSLAQRLGDGADYLDASSDPRIPEITARYRARAAARTQRAAELTERATRLRNGSRWLNRVPPTVDSVNRLKEIVSLPISPFGVPAGSSPLRHAGTYGVNSAWGNGVQDLQEPGPADPSRPRHESPR